MNKDYRNYTEYKEIEDLKRLDFIVDSIRSHDKPIRKILEVGCGNGNICLALASLGYSVVGMDIDEESIHNAKLKNKFDNLNFEVRDAKNVPTENDFDVVICSETLEHLDFPEEMVQKCSQILDLGGLLISTVPNGFGPRESLITKPVQYLKKTALRNVLIKFKQSLGYEQGTVQSSNFHLEHVQFFSKKEIFSIHEKTNFELRTFRKADMFERVFPYSLFTKKIIALQKLDCWLADYMPYIFTSGFYMAWIKKN